MIKDMFSKTMYYGAYRDNEKYIYNKPHLSKERWLKIQDILKTNYRSTSTKRDYLFSGLIKCCKCGRTLCGQTTFRDNGKYTKVYYRCNGKYVYNDCDSLNVSEEKLEKLLLEDIKPKLKRYIVSFNVKKSIKKTPEIDIKKLESELKRINNMYRKNGLTEEEYDRDYKEVSDKINKAQSKTEDKPANLNYLKDLLNSDIEKIYSKLDRNEKIMFWRSFISKIRMKESSKEVHRVDFV
jgi:site-specific DNA recombinase